MTDPNPTDPACFEPLPVPPEPGTPEAYWASANASQEVSESYRRIAVALEDITKTIRGLNQRTFLDPADDEQTVPPLLNSHASRLDAVQELERLDRVIVHLHGRSGVWFSQAARLRNEGTALLPAPAEPTDA